jgi:dTDP-4-amino-4,6-dideoxygalactose transaminase
VGVNSRLDSVQAAILQVKLQYLDQWNQQRQAIAQRYHEFLAPLPDIQLPQAIPGGRHVWNQYTILIRDRNVSNSTISNGNVGDLTWRDQIKDKLQESGVIAMVYYPIPLHLQRVYRDLNYQKRQFPAAEQAARQVLSLPIFPDLTLEEQEKVVYVLKDALT